jgi:hypothetical protein
LIFINYSSYLPELNLEHLQKSYDGSIAKLFNKQFGLTDKENDALLNKSVEELKINLTSVVIKAKELYKKDLLNNEFDETVNKSLITALFTTNDPDTGKPYDDDKVIIKLFFYLFYFV